MQQKATPIREGVLLISSEHTANDLRRLADKIEKKFDIKTIQAYCHKDEGHYDKITKEWKPNYHAHMVFDWTDHKTGKSIKLDKKDLSEFQTLVAIELGLERGNPSNLIHLNAIEYKNKKETESLIEIQKKFIETEKQVKDFTKINENDVKNLEVKGIIGINKAATIDNQRAALYNQIIANGYLKSELDKANDVIKNEIKEKSKLEESLKNANKLIEKQKVEINDLCLSVFLGNDKSVKDKGQKVKDSILEKLTIDLDKTLYLQEAWHEKITFDATLKRLVKDTNWRFSINEKNEITGLLTTESTVKITIDTVERVYVERESLREEKGINQGQTSGFGLN
jgi:hypothetical protein